MITTEKPVALATLADGAVEVMFQQELERVMRNIRDENTEPEVKREITLKVALFPDRERWSCQVVVASACKLAPIRGASTNVFIGYEGRTLVAVEQNPKQLGLALPGPVSAGRASATTEEKG